ncbi:hypothetical protein HNR65_003539, partial [Desulfosalsimonas propionicica]
NVRHMDSGIIGTSSSDYILFTNPSRHFPDESDNFRFLRYWWEVGNKKIAFNIKNSQSAECSGKKWFPYMKGGGFCQWYGNQEYTVNWHKNGLEIKNLGIETGKVASRPQNTKYYFQKGVTWSDLTSGRFAARLSPGGFIFDVKGSSVFPNDIPLVLALLNSSFAYYILTLLNPTISFQVGDLSRLPVPYGSSESLVKLVNQTIDLVRMDSKETENTYDFIQPPNWHNGIEELIRRNRQLKQTEQQIDEEIYQLYGINQDDRKAIEYEIGSNPMDNVNPKDAEDEDITPISKETLARQWISYAVGIIMGRFQPSVENGLGRGDFTEEINSKLQALADPDGILVMDEGHSDDLPARVLDALSIMLGETEAEEVVKTATGKEGAAETLLRTYLERTFFKEHIKQYRKRPVYWLLQSPKKKYSVWLFHEKISKDTLFLIRSNKYIGSKMNLLEGQIADLQISREQAQGRKKRDLENNISELSDILDDIREFDKLIKFITEERGYRHHIDDGVLLNMAPIWELIPSWQAEPKKAWQALERGDYDWAYQAMDHWPDRVKKKCLTNKSFAIAHGLEELYDE